MDGANPHPESFPPQQVPGNFRPPATGVPTRGTPANPYGGEPLPYPDQAPAPYPAQYPSSYPSSYPSTLPPPVPYPGPQRGVSKRTLLISAAVVLVVSTIIGGVLYADVGGDRGLSANAAKSTIQGYLDALLHEDKKTVARHALCGLYDGVKDHSADLAVANLASDAFRRQFSAAEVTSIDKVVMLSSNQAQVLFTMQVTPSGRSPRGSQPKADVQAVAQLLIQPGDSLVCSYLPRPLDSE
jgi:hypothetical protein